jgi:uncharacterized protein
MAEHLRSRFTSNDKIRILSLDGGGIRGIFTLGILEKLEFLLREKHGKSDMVLADHYDIISGTSTGAIIGTCLALGKQVSEIIELYNNLGTKIFNDTLYLKRFLGAKSIIRNLFDENYDSNNLEKFLQKELGDITIGSEEVKCGLIINAKRADTNSLWSITNHPDGKYYNANKNIRLDVS